MTRKRLLDFLSVNQISFELFEHPPLFTCEDAAALAPKMPGAMTKNLFLQYRSPPCKEQPGTKEIKYLLVTVPEHKRVDLKALGVATNTGKLSFASPEALNNSLQLTPGAVSLLGLLFDPAHCVTPIIDCEIWKSGAIQCHPMENTATCVISHVGLVRFFELTGHVPAIINIPERLPA